jgi:ATP-dependent DNA ligase
MEQIDFASFASAVGVMKPNSAKKEDAKAKQKLDALLDDPTYALEEKIDGCHYKMIGYRFFSTENVEKTDNFPHLKEFFQKLKMFNLIVDGEIHYPGKTSQYATHVTGASASGAKHFQEQNGYIHYTIFDILRTPKANWTLRNTYIERRKLLQYLYDTFIGSTPLAEFIHLSPMTLDGKRQFLEEILNAGLEGGVLKKLDSQYIMGKKPMWQWMKIKQEDDTDLVIMGFEPAKVDYTGANLETWLFWKPINGVDRPVTKFHFFGWIGSVVLGAYVNGVLTRICTASGISEELRKDMTEDQDKYVGRVARVTYMEKTDDGYPRHPALKNIHEDKSPQECIWEFN